MTIQEFRTHFYSSAKQLHLNNAAQAPISALARSALCEWSERMYSEGAFSFFPMVHAMEEARTKLAQFLSCQPSEISFYPGASSAISQVAKGFPLSSGDEILVWDQEYPSNFYPWSEAAKKAGATVKTVSSGDDLSTPVENLIAATTPNTKIIAISWVQFRTGARTDLKALADFAKRKNIFTCVDVIQGAGLFPINFQDSGIDALCGGSHKWFCSPHGAAFMVLKQEHHPQFLPLSVGAMTFGTPDTLINAQLPYQKGPSRFEPGGRAFAEIAALGASLELFLSFGINSIQAESQRLGKKLILGLKEKNYLWNSPHGSSAEDYPGGIVNFSASERSPLKSNDEIAKLFLDQGVSYSLRLPGVRLSPHAFNSDQEIDRVLELLSNSMTQRSS